MLRFLSFFVTNKLQKNLKSKPLTNLKKKLGQTWPYWRIILKKANMFTCIGDKGEQPRRCRREMENTNTVYNLASNGNTTCIYIVFDAWRSLGGQERKEKINPNGLMGKL